MLNDLFKELEMRLFDIDTPTFSVETKDGGMTLTYDYGAIHYNMHGRFRICDLKPELQLAIIPMIQELVAEALKLRRLRAKAVAEAKQTLVDLIEELK